MRFLAFIGALGILVAVAAAVFFLGGFYSVAGTAPEPEIVKWALIQVRKASIVRHATEKPPSAFDDATVRSGAKAYLARGCANCHGAPGVGWAKFSEGLRPDPPDLKDVVKGREPEHLFWVIKNGINMTGMPSFALAGVADPEIWQIVAFVKKLPDVSETDFKNWTSASAPAPDAAPPAPPASAMPPAPDAAAPPPAPQPPADPSPPAAPPSPTDAPAPRPN